MPKPGKTGVARILDAAGYSWLGLKAAYKYEAAFRQECFLLLLLTPLALWLGDGGVEYALLIGCLLIVLLAELVNSAIEAVVDRVSSEHHELAGRAKDIGSAVVFMAMINSTIVWGFVLFF
ncbi:diacylglycerol kinase [Pseudomonadota bacterium]